MSASGAEGAARETACRWRGGGRRREGAFREREAGATAQGVAGIASLTEIRHGWPPKPKSKGQIECNTDMEASYVPL